MKQTIRRDRIHSLRISSSAFRRRFAHLISSSSAEILTESRRQLNQTGYGNPEPIRAFAFPAILFSLLKANNLIASSISIQRASFTSLS